MLLLCLFWISEVNAACNKVLLPPPVWECIQTVGGDVVLNWSVVPDPGGNFVEYQVHSTQDGLIATIPNINTTTYTDLGVSSIKNYFITVIDNVSGPASSTTIENLVMTLNNPANGTAIINWNNTNFPLAPPPARPIVVNREFPVGTWNIVDSVTSPTTQNRDTIDICSAFLNYQITFPGNGCDFTSNVIGDIFEDKISPDIPVVSNVTIDSLTGLVSIDWNQNNQPDTYGYIIYLQNSVGNVVEIDTVWGVTNTNFTYSENTSTGPLTYSVAAFDSCFTTSSPPTYQTSAKANIHTTIFLEGYYNPCGSTGVLNWNAYSGWNVDHYEIYVKGPTGPWNMVQSTSNLNYNEIFTSSGIYEIIIMATHVDGRKSFSNKLNLNVFTNGAPSINYILSASVIDQEVHLRHLVDTAGNVIEVAFERQRKDGSFYEIGRSTPFDPISYFNDTEADVEQVNAYRAVIIDSCGFKTTISDTVFTTVLSVLGDSINNINTVSWTPYIGYDGPILSYDLYRIIDGVLNPVAIASVGPNTHSFNDYVAKEYVRNRLCYYVVAVEDFNSYGYAETANSNVRCSEFSPHVFIPNSFTPGGLNPLFQPKYTYMDLPDFEMNIYNRWGEEIYHSLDPLEGWNGSNFSTNTPAPNGVYIYFIRFSGIDDKKLEFKGHVNLLR